MSDDRGHAGILLDGALVLTMDEESTLLRPGRVLVVDGEIVSVGDRIEAPEDCLCIDLSGQVLLPGLIQAHIHLGQTFFRGLAEGRALLPWLRERIWPLEAAHTDESAYWSALLGAAECLLGGTTTVQEIGLGPGARGLLEGLAESGLRAVAGMCLMDEGDEMPAGLALGTDEALRSTVELGEAFDGAANGLISYSLNPRFILSASDALWHQVRDLAQARDWAIHTHALEHAEETDVVRALKQGRDEIEYFDSEGVLEAPLCIAHGVQLEPRHLGTLDRERFSVAHCPSANLRLGSGIADVAGLCAAGFAVGVGSDGAACNNDLDCFEEIRLAALLQQLRGGPGAFDGEGALRLATSLGARAIGLEKRIGSIEVGKRADLLVLDPSGPEFSAAEACDLHDLITFVASRSAVRHVMVDGRWRVWEGALTGLDLSQIARRAEASRSDLLERSGLSL